MVFNNTNNKIYLKYSYVCNSLIIGARFLTIHFTYVLIDMLEVCQNKKKIIKTDTILRL